MQSYFKEEDNKCHNGKKKNETETEKKIIERSIKVKICCLKRKTKIDKELARLIKKKRVVTNK